MFGASTPSTQATGGGLFSNVTTASTAAAGAPAFGFGGQKVTAVAQTLFGAPAATSTLTGPSSPPSLFGAGSLGAAPAFGAAAASSIALGSCAAPTFGASPFSSCAPSYNVTTSGATAAPPLFGTTGGVNAAPGQSVFGLGTTSAAPTMGFAFDQHAQSTVPGTATTTGFAFGQPATTATGFSAQSSAAYTTSIALGIVSAAATTHKFVPMTGTDTIVRDNQTVGVYVSHQCITTMKVYEGKSLEELRVEDYTAGRRWPQAGGGSVAGTLFNTSTTSTPASTAATTAIFGQQVPRPTVFGNPAATVAQTVLFGTSARSGERMAGTPFSTTTTSATQRDIFVRQATTPTLSHLPTTVTSSGSLFGSTVQPSGITFGLSAATAVNPGSLGQPATRAPLNLGSTTPFADGGLFNTNGAAKPSFGTSFTAAPLGKPTIGTPFTHVKPSSFGDYLTAKSVLDTRLHCATHGLPARTTEMSYRFAVTNASDFVSTSPLYQAGGQVDSEGDSNNFSRISKQLQGLQCTLDALTHTFYEHLAQCRHTQCGGSSSGDILVKFGEMIVAHSEKMIHAHSEAVQKNVAYVLNEASNNIKENLNARLEAAHAEILLLTLENDYLKDAKCNTNGDVMSLRSHAVQNHVNVDSNEQYDCMRQLLIYGIEESDDVDDCVRRIVANTLDIPREEQCSIAIFNVVRLDEPGIVDELHTADDICQISSEDRKSPRPVLVTFNQPKARDAVWNRRSALRNTGVRFGKVLTPTSSTNLPNIFDNNGGCYKR